jgi:hypothetical protein
MNLIGSGGIELKPTDLILKRREAPSRDILVTRGASSGSQGLHDWSALMHGNYLLATWNYLFANWKFGSLVAEYQAAPRDVSIDRMRAAEEGQSG